MKRSGIRAAFTMAACVWLASCGGGGGSSSSPPSPPPPPPPPIGALSVATVNNRADLISGGDAVVEISSSATGNVFPGLRVDVDGRDVTSAFAATGNKMVGLVTGFVDGANVISARGTNLTGGRLTITNSPRSGPVLSGAQITPYYCATPTPQVVSGTTPARVASGLSGAPDASCNITTEFKYYYRTTNAGCSFALPDPVWSIGATATTVPAQPAAPSNPCYKTYNSSAPRPADMATATTDAGVTVDFIVRLERGTMNRGIYDMVSLFNPATGWTAAAPQPQWNRKVYFTFAGGTGQPRRQVRPNAAWPNMEANIRRGYVVVTNSMTDSARNSNRVTMSETVMMMKEHIADTYGPIKFAIGSGCSGGSINSNTTASIMPGILDGVITSCTYADSETTALEVVDCVMLVEAYQKPAMLGAWSGLGLSQSQINARKAAINGHIDQTGCHAWMNSFGSNGKPGLFYQRGVIDTNTGAIGQSGSLSNNCELPNSAVYNPADPVTTANLPRCNMPNWAVSVWGIASGATQARNTIDNVGVQYGLKALNDGAITAEEFVVLNEVVGGIDANSDPTTTRVVASTEALETAYRSGVIMSGKQFARTAAIDMRGWDDSQINMPPGYNDVGGIHHAWFSFAVRDRLIAESDSGNAGNQALWRYSRPGLGPPSGMQTEALTTMDAWLTALKADTSSASLEQKVRSTRPSSSTDFCYLNADATQSVRVTNMATCDADPYLRPSLSPRQVAGGPRAENILKCQLKPLTPADYPTTTFTGGQWSRLQAVFAGGVCDWSRPGVGQVAAQSPLTFRAGPLGQVLPAAPTSTAIP